MRADELRALADDFSILSLRLTMAGVDWERFHDRVSFNEPKLFRRAMNIIGDCPEETAIEWQYRLERASTETCAPGLGDLVREAREWRAAAEMMLTEWERCEAAHADEVAERKAREKILILCDDMPEFREPRLKRALQNARRRVSRGMYEKVTSIHDHEGTLTVSWRDWPNEIEQDAFKQAWEHVGECASCVVHETKDAD